MFKILMDVDEKFNSVKEKFSWGKTILFFIRNILIFIVTVMLLLGIFLGSVEFIFIASSIAIPLFLTSDWVRNQENVE